MNIKGHLKGLPMLQHAEKLDSDLWLAPKAKEFRMGITTESDGHRFHIELPAETSFGTRGAEIRTTDPRCPFKLTMQFERDGNYRSYEFEIDYPIWHEQQLTELTLFDQTHQFTQALAKEHNFRVDYIDYGIPKEIISGVADRPDPDFADTFKILEIMRKLRVVCQKLDASAVFKEASEITIDDQLSIVRAYELLDGKTTPFEGVSFTITVADEVAGTDQLEQLEGRELDMKLTGVFTNVSFAGSAVASIPVIACIRAFKIVSRCANKIRIETLAGSTISYAPGLPLPA